MPITDGRARTTPLAIAQAVRARIVSGHHKPGQQLVEDRLAKEFGVSRIPVREALRLLEAEGFVELVPYRGAFVATVDRESAEHTMEIRAGLEPIAARRAAFYRNDEDLEVLRDAQAQAERALTNRQFDLLPGLNSTFHGAVWTASRNGELKSLLEQLSFRIAWVYSMTAHRRAPASWAEHAQILKAVSDGDDRRAERLMRDHIAKADEAYRRYHSPDLR